MNSLQVKRGGEVSRDELKQILFQWLQSRGILGELQAFLRTKMIEKLKETPLSPAPTSRSLSLKDKGMDLIVFEYLKNRKMTYTLSVFASESAAIREMSHLDEQTARRKIMDYLKINPLLRSSKIQKNPAPPMLEILIDTCDDIGSKKFESKSSQISETREQKLLLNIQTQTDGHDGQSIPKNSIATQTGSAQPPPSSETISALNDEIQLLRKQLSGAIHELRSYQLKVQKAEIAQTARKAVEVEEPIERSFVELSTFQTVHRPTVFDTLVSKADESYFEKKIKETQQFINGLDHRLEKLDSRFQKLSILNSRHDPDWQPLAERPLAKTNESASQH